MDRKNTEPVRADAHGKFIAVSQIDVLLFHVMIDLIKLRFDDETHVPQ